MRKESIYDRMTNAEKEVANMLIKYGIQWSFEQPVFVWDENKRPRVWTPDFYLTQFGIYLEVCGSKDFNYSYRKRVFTKNGYCVIFLHVFKKANRWESHFKRYLNYFLSCRTQAFSCIFNTYDAQ
jgi:hypothetical protein